MRVASVKSAVRVLEVLGYFKKSQNPQSLREISLGLGYPQSSATVLLKNLTQLGYLSYDRATRLYFPTLQVTALGDWISHALFGQGEVFEIMQDLHSATGETVSIALQNDVYIQYIRVIQSSHALRFVTEEGSMRPLTQSATGWLLMAAHSDTEVERLVRRANIATESFQMRQPIDVMMHRVKNAREQAWATAENIPLIGGATICVTLPITAQGRAVVLGMGGTIERIVPKKAEYLSLMLRLAAQLPKSVSNNKGNTGDSTSRSYLDR
jgi:DNA-binding IclR family transcriptional regulator